LREIAGRIYNNYVEDGVFKGMIYNSIEGKEWRISRII
jgi:hypothetical protein